MAYRRFILPEISSTSATVATPATVSSQTGPSVANAATVASPEPNSETPNPLTVATVTRAEPKSDHRPHTTTGANGQATGSAVSSFASATLATPATGSDGDDQAAMAVTGGVPAAYATAFAAMQMGCPSGVPEPRWRQAVNDAALFLKQWGEMAERLGWTADNLFGLHPTVPLSRVDAMGLVWLLKGQRVTTLT